MKNSNMNKIRSASRRLISTKGKRCCVCGTTKNLQRHHRSPHIWDVDIMCRKHHQAFHVANGTWGKGKKKMKPCKNCGTLFMPNHSKKHTTCSDACMKELCRQAAIKRWERVRANGK